MQALLWRPVLRLAQPVVRALLRRRATEKLAWRLIPRLQRLSTAHAPDWETVCAYDGSIRLRVDFTSHIESQIYWQGFQAADRGEMLLLGALVRPDSVVFDVGANVGVMSLYAARRAVAGEVHAFEPSPPHIERLKRNISMNGFRNILINPVGLSSAPGRRTLFLPAAEDGIRNTGGASFFAFAGEAEADCIERQDGIETVRLDDYVAERKLGRLDVMKIDVEGAELEVLKGGPDALARFRPVVLMEVGEDTLTRAGLTAGDVLAFWRDQSYDVYDIQQTGRIGERTEEARLRPHQNICCWPSERVLDPALV